MKSPKFFHLRQALLSLEHDMFSSLSTLNVSAITNMMRKFYLIPEILRCISTKKPFFSSSRTFFNCTYQLRNNKNVLGEKVLDHDKVFFHNKFFFSNYRVFHGVKTFLVKSIYFFPIFSKEEDRQSTRK